MRYLLILFVSLFFVKHTYSDETPKVFFENLENGQHVNSPLMVKFGVRGMRIVPAGIDEPMSGHHHLLVDTNLPNMGEPIPSDEHHIHFGKGQLETIVELTPGTHTLQLLLGNWTHIPHRTPIKSHKITVIVE
ncbi:MAG: DUF4399 domain-containing protein [Sphingomonadales bacterium]|jgi:hypothetical protein